VLSISEGNGGSMVVVLKIINKFGVLAGDVNGLAAI